MSLVSLPPGCLAPCRQHPYRTGYLISLRQSPPNNILTLGKDARFWRVSSTSCSAMVPDSSMDTPPLASPLPDSPAYPPATFEPSHQSATLQVVLLPQNLQISHNNLMAQTGVMHPNVTPHRALPVYMAVAYPPSPMPTTHSESDGHLSIFDLLVHNFFNDIEGPDFQASAGWWLRAKQWCQNKLQTWTWAGILGAAAAISTIIATVLVIVWK
ncbi:hypothetical protein DL93DRAFT_2103558 [Clavulina sp. PMI_390]|nr:hypothetical protein DL93DRAFT_2103558 [Clavulina sp. PMI_390]